MSYLHEHKIDHIAHLGPSVAAGIGTLLKLDTETIYQAVQQAAHTTITTRQSRKADISSWKAYAPAYAGKNALEAVDRCMRGEGSPSPIYEGEDSIIAWILSGPDAVYQVPLPEPGGPSKLIPHNFWSFLAQFSQLLALPWSGGAPGNPILTAFGIS